MSSVYDYYGSLDRMGGSEQLFRDMVGFLFEDGPRWWAEIQEAHADRDALRLHRLAHTLKGMVANFGAAHATDMAANVERQSKENDWPALANSIPELGDALNELLIALKSYAPNSRPVLF